MVVNVAVIGTGYWGKNYVRVFNELEKNFKLCYVVDTNLELLAGVKSKYPSVKVTDKLDDVLQDDTVQAVVVVTPASTHYNFALRCLQANKHVLVEKPLTVELAHSRELVAEAEKRKLTLMVGFTVLFVPAIQKAKQMIDDPLFGETYCVYSRRQNMGIVRPDVNVVWDLAPHDIAIFNYWLGMRPERVSAVGVKYLHGKFEDSAFINLFYPNNVIANAHVSWADPQKTRETTIISSNKRICVNDVNPMESLKVTECTIKHVPSELNYGEFQHITQSGNSTIPYLPPAEPLKVQCLHFAECIEKGTKCIASGTSGLENVCILLAINESIANGGSPVQVKYD